ncbi:MAG TPA: PASTA domain-containing protein [Candidatus Angelobacter sp.]|nr:PASTA domain-containing protein [Candidatus Angelobacter sp.]
MLKLLRFSLLGMVLLLVCFASALLSMRVAIHGREVRVPKFKGLTPADAERLANSYGLILSIESRFFSSEIPEGRIVSQAPAPNTTVRRGWKVQAAESLGPQKAIVPNLLGESERVAELNISRRGLQIGTVAAIHFAGAQPSTVIAQNPSADAKNAPSPKISLIVAAPESNRAYVMPSLLGKNVEEASSQIQRAGLTLGRVSLVEDDSGPAGTILRQYPSAGQKIVEGATVSLEARKPMSTGDTAHPASERSTSHSWVMRPYSGGRWFY